MRRAMCAIGNGQWAMGNGQWKRSHHLTLRSWAQGPRPKSQVPSPATHEAVVRPERVVCGLRLYANLIDWLTMK